MVHQNLVHEFINPKVSSGFSINDSILWCVISPQSMLNILMQDSWTIPKVISGGPYKWISLIVLTLPWKGLLRDFYCVNAA